ncbi:MAG: hypothetical protein PVG39_00910 [Desulfobacteraceae bacterium]|jgi:hypothetical protein
MKINNDFILSIDIVSDEPHFNPAGCENCANGLGNSVYEVKAFIDNFKDHYEVEICRDCLLAYHYSEQLDKGCNNVFSI